ncbi:MAG: stalk domain-containing protein [Turicibacter sp.]|nr:stalk domain-containing protein [Turicibacter sp.]
MKKNMLLILFVISAIFATTTTAQANRPLVLVAHAGGGTMGFAGSNSLEALHNSVKLGFRYIELDMIPTSDGHIVLNHSWESLALRMENMQNIQKTHAEFMSGQIFGQFTPMDLPMLIDFLRENPQIRIITDTKESDYLALHSIAEAFPTYRNRFIPQAYAFEDIQTLRNLGFNDIILTMYMLPTALKLNPTRFVELANQEDLWAVTIPDDMPNLPRFAAINAPVFVHTIDSIERANELRRLGFAGIYTGFLYFDAQNNLIVGETEPRINIEINGKMLEFNRQRPVIRNGFAMVPLRSIFEHLGYNVALHGETIILTNGVNRIATAINSDIFMLNGIPQRLEQSSQIMNDTLMIPLRNILSSLGYILDWDEQTRTIIVR